MLIIKAPKTRRVTQDDDDLHADICLRSCCTTPDNNGPHNVLQLRPGWYCCVTQISVDETLMDENIITSINRWKPEKHQTLDENIITSINRWKPEKHQTLDENIITSINPWKQKVTNFCRLMVMGGKVLYIMSFAFCFFVFLQVKNNNVVVVIFGFIDFSTLVRVFLCFVLKV